jgi:rhamnose utilization protein RhaD (predicted bifunctional aldolase and dehydrogenase)/NAD(P)-dependent dehydrogenase (short-subunit alcohol dehydrogenase family)
MDSLWNDEDAKKLQDSLGPECNEALAQRIYASRLLGAAPDLVLHGGGNTSVKTTYGNVWGEKVPVVYVKASGVNLAHIGPEGFCPLDQAYLQRLRTLPSLTDEEMFNELLTHCFRAASPRPSLEALLHVFIGRKFIDHSHPDAILALANRADGEEVLRQALGPDVLVQDYVKPGFALAQAAATLWEETAQAKAMVLMQHGLVTWGDTAQDSYEATIDVVTRAEAYLKGTTTLDLPSSTNTAKVAQDRYRAIAPIVRGLLAQGTNNPDRPWQNQILRPLLTVEIRALVDSDRGKTLALSAPLTTDHLVRTKPYPLWLDEPELNDLDKFRGQMQAALASYASDYDAYYERNVTTAQADLVRFDSAPRVILIPGVGAICAGRDVQEADIVRDITSHTLLVKAVQGAGTYAGLNDTHLFQMEYRATQQAKVEATDQEPLSRSIALVTGAAGAIGAGICQELLEARCHVAACDIQRDALSTLVGQWRQTYGDRVRGVVLDVTKPNSVRRGVDQVVEEWGGLDLVVANAGVAHVCSLAEMEPADFRRVQKVNVDGTLHLLAEAARHFARQGTGGDIVLVSTKNVFAPGAQFGAYSATKAAAHQLARIASLELASLDVRVNMVAPDGVFAHGERKSGLWAEVGPDRMRARNLDEAGLEAYYQNRNLLKSRITASHVAKGVLFFATRQTPTTGATIPIDGGLPDSTPR